MLNHDEIPSQSHLYEIALGIQNPRDRALFIMEYLTGGRVGEITRRLKKSSMKLVKHKGKDFLLIENFFTEKNRQISVRNLPIPIWNEMQLWKLLEEYLSPINPNVPIFTINRQTCWKKMNKIISTFKTPSKCDTTCKKPCYRHKIFLNANHYMRHCRNTHLVVIYGYKGFDLMQYNGWSDERPAKSYLHLMWTYLADKMV